SAAHQDQTPKRRINAAGRTGNNSSRATNRNCKSISSRVSAKGLLRSGAVHSAVPGKIEDELAALVTEVPPGNDWLHEIKYAGYRLIATIVNGKVTLRTRRQQDWTHRYHDIADAAAELPVSSSILDGELVALKPSGVSSFQELQNAGRPGSD